MSGIVEICVKEISKLKEKVRPLILVSKPKGGGSSSSVAAAAAEEETQEKATNLLLNETTLSEATVCMLMDRFVPW